VFAGAHASQQKLRLNRAELIDGFPGGPMNDDAHPSSVPLARPAEQADGIMSAVSEP
jgi:hypothetical protein